MNIRSITPPLFIALTIAACSTESAEPKGSPDAGADDSTDKRDDSSSNDSDSESNSTDSNSSNDTDKPTGDTGDTSSETSDETRGPAQGGETTDGNTGIDTDDDTTEDPTTEEPNTPATASFFLPTTEPDNTVAPRLRIDKNGGVHAVYAAYAGGGAYYAYCASGCDDRENFDVVYFPTEGTVANAMLALTKEGKPRVLLSAYMDASFAQCDDDCTDPGNWSMGVIYEHGSDQEITGEALALDREGKPHFLAHTYRAFLGIGQKDPFTYHVSCLSGDCTQEENWVTAEISDQIWEESRLFFDADGTAHLGFVALVMDGKVIDERITAYATCSDDCNSEEGWEAVGLAYNYVDDLEAFALKSTFDLALTSDGKPRIVTLAKSDGGDKNLIYFECDEDCTSDTGFQGSILTNSDALQDGIDLELTKQDHPRFAYNLDYNIFVASCDDLPCVDPDADWNLTTVEAASSIPVDDIILFPNCTVAAWFLHTPRMVLDKNDNPYVGYQARDVSGGVHNPDPTKPDCVAGTDMTLTRMTYVNWGVE
jgi:hypothetical protein